MSRDATRNLDVRTRRTEIAWPAKGAKIAIKSSKGGSGKTTVSIGLAGAALSCGLSVEVIDADYMQHSLCDWIGSKSELSISVMIPTQAAERMRKSSAQLVLVDTAGSDDAAHGLILSAADLVLIPASDSILDIKPAIEAIRSANRVGTLSRLLFANIDRLEGRRIKTAKADAVGNFRFQTIIPRRVAVRDSVRRLCLLRDYPPAAEVHSKFVELLQEISELLHDR